MTLTIHCLLYQIFSLDKTRWDGIYSYDFHIYLKAVNEDDVKTTPNIVTKSYHKITSIISEAWSFLQVDNCFFIDVLLRLFFAYWRAIVCNWARFPGNRFWWKFFNHMPVCLTVTLQVSVPYIYGTKTSLEGVRIVKVGNGSTKLH